MTQNLNLSGILDVQGKIVFPVSLLKVEKVIVKKNSVTYKITCETCLKDGILSTYEGETGRNTFSRGLEHQQGLQQNSEKSALWKHCVSEHSSQEADFSMMIIQSHSSCLNRQVHEAVRISRTEAVFIMNSKSEFHQAPLVRVVATTGLQEEQSTAASQGLGLGAGGRSRREGGRGGGGGGRASSAASQGLGLGAGGQSGRGRGGGRASRMRGGA